MKSAGLICLWQSNPDGRSRFLFKLAEKVENIMSSSWCVEDHVFIGHHANASVEVGQQSWLQKKKVRHAKRGEGDGKTSYRADN